MKAFFAHCIRVEATFATVLVVALLSPRESSAQLTITNLGPIDPSGVFLDGVPSDPADINSFKRINEGDDTGASIARNRGQVFTVPDTGDSNSGWSLTDLTVRWDDSSAEYPVFDFQVRLSIYPWQDLSNAEASNVDFSEGPTELPLRPIFTGTGMLPILSPNVDLFDGDRLQFNLGSPVELRENTAYGFLIEFDRQDGLALRIDDDAFRLESTNVGASVAGTSLATNFDYTAEVNGLTQLNSQIADDVIHQLSGVATNIADDPFASLEVDRDTGNMSLKTNLEALSNLDVTGYTITTASGGVRTDDASWLSLADSDPDWQENGTISSSELSETFVGIAGSDQLSQSQTIDLGNAWDVSPFEDLVMTLDTSGGSTITVPIRYVSSVGSTEAFAIGDYNLNGGIDIGDWPTVRDNLLSDVSGMDTFGRYNSGDLNLDGLVNSADFLLFRNLFEDANGGSFAAALASVPEPSSTYLLLGVFIVVLGVTRCRFAAHLSCQVAIPATVKNLSLVAISTMCLLACASARAQSIADFNSSVAGGTLTEIDAANLNLGTAGGTWTVNQIGLQADDGGPGASKIEAYSDSASDFQFQLDGPRLTDRSTPFDYRLNLTSSAALTGANTLSFDAAVRRAGAGETSERNGLIRGLDSGGSILFELEIDGLDAANRGTIGLVGQTPSVEMINFVNANNPIATTDMTNISVTLGVSSFNVTVGGNAAYTGIPYTESVTELSELHFSASGVDAGFSGYSIDNLEILDLSAERIALNVNTTNGAVSLTSPISQDIISYTIDGTALDFANGWTSLQASSFDDGGWEEAGGSSATALGEVRLEGATTVDSSTVAPLGTIYNEAVDAQDLGIAYILADQTSLTGVVNYFAGDASDFDADGDVDANDLAIFEANYGANAAADADNDGDSDGIDFLAWQRQFGNGVGLVATAITVVPEPSSAFLIVTGCLVFTRRRRACLGN